MGHFIIVPHRSEDVGRTKKPALPRNDGGSEIADPVPGEKIDAPANESDENVIAIPFSLFRNAELRACS